MKKAAAAMAVGVGSFADPSDMQGLSHYLEHMLFMGSAEFPGESEYTDYLAQHAGTSNAYTEAGAVVWTQRNSASCLHHDHTATAARHRRGSDLRNGCRAHELSP